MKLNGKKVLVTAGANGIGLAIATTFKQRGANVYVTDIDPEALSRLQQNHPDIYSSQSDISKEEDIRNMMEAAEKTLGGLDILVNNAGIAGPTKPVEQITREEWDNTLNINLTGQFLCIKYALPLLRKEKNAAIINLSSAAGRLGFAGRSPYSASKWAVIGLTRSLAIELGPENIRVNAICPGAVDGPRIQHVISEKARMLNKPHEEIENLYKGQSSMHCMVTAQDIAHQALFLASDLSMHISGQALAVDGHTEKLF